MLLNRPAPIEVGVVNASDYELTERVLPSNYLFF